MVNTPSQEPVNKAQHGQPVVHSQPNMTQTVSPPGIGTLISTDGLAEMLGISRMTVYRLIERRALPVYRVCRRIRFKLEDVQNFVESQRTPEDQRQAKHLIEALETYVGP
ncbi:helix-turn-helix domain-containing protein [Patescibacteria group bacterium]|nr:helix-turn-helix domain-containing protein [Patescibacteria group bacterium]